MAQDEQRLIAIETVLSEQQHMLDELNEVIIAQAREIDVLKKQNLYLAEKLRDSGVKPQSEETPPPHY